LLGQTVENEVKIDLPGNRDIELGHGAELLVFFPKS
jgi:hypothetical protein